MSVSKPRESFLWWSSSGLCGFNSSFPVCFNEKPNSRAGGRRKGYCDSSDLLILTNPPSPPAPPTKTQPTLLFLIKKVLFNRILGLEMDQGNCVQMYWEGHGSWLLSWISRPPSPNSQKIKIVLLCSAKRQMGISKLRVIKLIILDRDSSKVTSSVIYGITDFLF